MSEWKKVKIGDVCTITKGVTGIQKAVAGKYSMVTLAEERATHNEFQFDCSAVIVPLVSSTGHGHASMKRVHYQEGKFALGSILCALVPNDSNFLNPKYLHIYLSYLKEKLLVPLMRGAANVSLSISNIKTVEIIVPPIEKQIEIIELEKKVRTQRQKLYEKNNDQNNYLTLLRQQILHDAISGKLTADWRVKNPDIEPASKLLEKIKAEKEKLIANPPSQGFGRTRKKIKKEKPLSKISEDEVPFELPENWEWCRLGEIVSFSENNNIHSNLNENEIVNYVDIDAVNNKTFLIENVKEKKVKDLSSRARRVLSKGDIIYSLVRPYLNNIAIVQEDRPNYIGSTGFTVFSGIIVINRFIFNILLSGYIRKLYLEFLSGFNSPSITHDQFKNTVIPLPPLAEQKAIVAKIEKLMKQISQLEERIKQNKQDAQMLMQSFLVEAFRK